MATQTLTPPRLRGVEWARLGFLWPVALAAGLFFRLWRLDASLWYDEIFTTWLAGLPAGRLVDATLGDVHPPLYYLFISAWGKLFGLSEVAVRLPSVLAGMGLIWVVWRLGHSLKLDEGAIRLATLITLFAPFQVHYSQEARMYGIMAFCLGLSAIGLAEGKWIWAIFGSVVSLYLHNTAPLFVFALWGAFSIAPASIDMSDPPDAPRPRFLGIMLYPAGPKFILSALITGLLYLPGLYTTLYQFSQLGHGYWIAPISSPGRLIATIDDLLFFVPNNVYQLGSGMVTSIAVVLIMLDCLRSPEVRRGGAGLAGLIFWGSLFLITLVSIIWQPILISRIAAPVAIFYYLQLGVVFSRSKKRLLSFGLLFGMVAVFVLSTNMTGAVGRDYVGHDLDETEPTDGFYHLSVGTGMTWQFYYPAAHHVTWSQPTGLAQALTPRTRRAMGIREVTEFEQVRSERDRWWIVWSITPTTTPEEISYYESLREKYPTVSETVFMEKAGKVSTGMFLVEGER